MSRHSDRISVAAAPMSVHQRTPSVHLEGNNSPMIPNAAGTKITSDINIRSYSIIAYF
jgi:hypothetical protein